MRTQFIPVFALIAAGLFASPLLAQEASAPPFPPADSNPPASWDVETARKFLPVVVAPKYPKKERKAGIQGTAELYVDYDNKGWPVQVTIRKSSGNENLDAAALKAVRQWRVTPGTKDGVPVAGTVVIPITFSL